MALSGGFLILFLLGHVSGNTLLFRADGGEAFNRYARFMTTNPGVKVLSYLTYFSVIIHIIYSILLTLYNRKARPVSYAVSKPKANSSWNSRNMGILGSIILVFIVIHMRTFWYEMHFGAMPVVAYEGETYKDLYKVVVEAFSHGWYVLLYVVSMLFLAFHLSHGFASAFKTFGISNKKYTPLISTLGMIFSWGVCLAFASMPAYLYFTNL